MYRKHLPLHIKKIWLAHEWIGALVVFCIAAAAFTWWTGHPTFVDPDSFYHLKITELIMQRQQPIVEFPWLPFTTLADSYVDHHFLYHIALIPFVLFFGSFIGMKVATIFFASLAVTVFYIVLRLYHVRYSTFFTLLLLTTYGFGFRMALSKAPSVAIILILLSFVCIAFKKNRFLIALSFLFVWAYGGFLLLPAIAACYCITDIGFTAYKDYAHIRAAFRRSLLLLAAVFGGTIAGLLIHPAFPHHFQFYWHQIIDIALLNYQKDISVGGEWYPTSIPQLIHDTTLLSFCMVLSIGTWIATRHKQNATSATTFVIATVFLLLTLKSQRYIEYYAPFGFLFVALTLHYSGILDRIRYWIRQMCSRKTHPALQVGGILFCIYIVCISGGIAAYNSTRLHNSLSNGIPFTQFSQAGAWLREHSTKGDIIFHDDWDEFPMLFYQLTRGRYIAGLDPTFFYLQQEDLYWKWVNITTAKQQDNLFETISKDFQAQFVIVQHDHDALRKNIIRDERFDMVYEDEEVTIFRIPRQAPAAEPETIK